jgi:hypothetical protein
MFEHHAKPLLPRRIFYRRVVRNVLIGVAFIAVSLGIGMAGYHHFEKMSWLDAFVNASMLLSGMGPVGTLQTDGGKMFAGGYALFSGLALVAAIGIIFAPVFHRFLHKFHLEDSED